MNHDERQLAHEYQSRHKHEKDPHDIVYWSSRWSEIDSSLASHRADRPPSRPSFLRRCSGRWGRGSPPAAFPFPCRQVLAALFVGNFTAATFTALGGLTPLHTRRNSGMHLWGDLSFAAAELLEPAFCDLSHLCRACTGPRREHKTSTGHGCIHHQLFLCNMLQIRLPLEL